ncbi:MAG: hypothetical protein BMS9Abin09_0613 [Gammaproteobacteria bacterium]|nr:MAG: hypothetical protein BMS9Abin09_0613 [Gammaproteobacteria bacterium]
MNIRCWQKLIVILLLSGGVSAQAEMYRWIDDSGQVHYEDRQRGAKSSPIKPYSKPDTTQPAPQERMEKTRRLLNAYRIERQQKREQKAEQKAEKDKHIKNCNRARDDVRRYHTYRRIYNLDKEGNRVYLSDQDRVSLLQRSQDKVTRWCS